MTRLSQYLSGVAKTYRAEITLGISTDSLDGEGTIVARSSAAGIALRRLEEELAGLTGDLMVPPPLHSAVHHEGRRLYEIARRGEQVEVEPRPMRVLRFEPLGFAPGEAARALTEVECAKGTYVRSLAGLLGERLGCGGYLSFLVRTRVGVHRVADAHTVSELAELKQAGRLREALVPPAEAVADFPRLRVSQEEGRVLVSGNMLPAPSDLTAGQIVAALLADGRLLGMCEILDRDGERVVQPRRMLIAAEEL